MSAESDLSFVVDEIGIASGRFHELRLKSCYQPIYRIEGNRLRPFAVEALAIAFAEGRAVPAKALFQRAHACEREALERLCLLLHMRNFHNIFVDGLQLFLNAEPTMTDIDVEHFEWLLVENEIAPDDVVCEITEGADRGEERLLALVSSLRGLGARIAVDDFGIGHSTPQRIRLVEPDIVKIDGGWFARAAAYPEAAALLPGLFRCLHDAGRAVLVEGIENRQLLALAVEAGADAVQGYLLARPALAGTIFDERTLALETLLDGEVVKLPCGIAR